MSRSGSRALGQCDARVRQRAAARAAEKWPHKFCPRTGWRRARMRDGPSATSTTFVFSGFIAIVAFCAAVRDSLRGLGVGVSSVALARPLSFTALLASWLGRTMPPRDNAMYLGRVCSECGSSAGSRPAAILHGWSVERMGQLFVDSRASSRRGVTNSSPLARPPHLSLSPLARELADVARVDVSSLSSPTRVVDGRLRKRRLGSRMRGAEDGQEQ